MSEIVGLRAEQIVFAALESYSMVGGLQQFNRRVVTALSDLAERRGAPRPVVVLKGDARDHVNTRTERVDFLPCGRSKLLFMRNFIASTRKADVLFLGHVNLLPLAMLAKLKRPQLKLVLFVHGHDVWGAAGTRQVRIWEPFFARRLNRIASVSDFTAKRMMRAFDLSEELFTIFPNAVDPIPITDRYRHMGPARILTVSRLAVHDHGKHHDAVLKAMPHVLRHVPNARYQIIGDGVIRVELERLAHSLGISHAVDFLGRVSDRDLAKAYGEATVFAMPSEKEGFGIVFLEAWQRGLPVLCGTGDAAHEVVTDGVDGFAVHHDDHQKLADRLVLLLKDPTLAKRMGEAGQRKVLDKYMMPSFTDNLDRLLKGILS